MGWTAAPQLAAVRQDGCAWTGPGNAGPNQRTGEAMGEGFK